MTKEMMIVGSIILALLVILLVLVLVVCCRKSNAELTTVQLEREVEKEKQALEAYKQRMSYSPSRYPSEDGVPQTKHQQNSPKKKEIPV